MGFIIVQEVGLLRAHLAIIPADEHVHSLQRFQALLIAKLLDLLLREVVDALHVVIVNEQLPQELIVIILHVHPLGIIGTRPWHDVSAYRRPNCDQLHK